MIFGLCQYQKNTMKTRGYPQNSIHTQLYTYTTLYIHNSIHTQLGQCWFSHQVMCNSCNLMDCSPWGSSVHGISKARILEWVAISSSRGFSWPRDRTQISCIAGRFFTAEPLGKPHVQLQLYPKGNIIHALENVSVVTSVWETLVPLILVYTADPWTTAGLHICGFIFSLNTYHRTTWSGLGLIHTRGTLDREEPQIQRADYKVIPRFSNVWGGGHRCI